jgi:branched-chain amino acid aminotransferase
MLLPLEKARIGITDRCFTYGDGLFETIKISRSKLVRWAAHSHRLFHGADLLKIPVPFGRDELQRIIEELVQENRMADGLARIQISRGPGERGYFPAGLTPAVVITMHPLPVPPPGRSDWEVVTASFPLFSRDPLAGIKSCNKLRHILASLEAAEQGAHDAVFLNESGEVVETTSCNLFWVEDQTICTPPLSSGALPGVTRGAVLQLAPVLNLAMEERPASPEKVKKSKGVFLTSTGIGLMPVGRWDGEVLAMPSELKKLCELLADSLRRVDLL